MRNARSCRGQQFSEVRDVGVRTMPAKHPCLPGTAHAQLDVIWAPGRGTGQRIVEDSAFGWLTGELLQMAGF
jgi:hypothetical protein